MSCSGEQSGLLKKVSLPDNLRGCRTGGRVVEGTGLENRHTGEPGIESSNLSLSVVRTKKSARAQLSAVLDVWSAPFAGRRLKTMWGRVAEWFKAHAWKVCVR